MHNEISSHWVSSPIREVIMTPEVYNRIRREADLYGAASPDTYYGAKIIVSDHIDHKVDVSSYGDIVRRFARGR